MNFKETLLETYPDIFEGLTDHQTHDIINTAASNWLDGFEPTRRSLELSANIYKGTITAQEAVDVIFENTFE
ncbi:hypothetical protein [Stomatohabitans albus]|uniref:antitoxin VbhA family protein n=1 Tax=Stomatohabitans albus TaxID=3110766 RepID=UPI00300CB259